MIMSTFLVIIIVLAVIVIGYFISTQRSLVSLDEMCKNALSQIEVQLNSRFDAIMAMAKTAAKYAAHESETIIQAIQARGGRYTAPRKGRAPWAASSPTSIPRFPRPAGTRSGRANPWARRWAGSA